MKKQLQNYKITNLDLKKKSISILCLLSTYYKKKTITSSGKSIIPF